MDKPPLSSAGVFLRWFLIVLVALTFVCDLSSQAHHLYGENHSQEYETFGSAWTPLALTPDAVTRSAGRPTLPARPAPPVAWRLPPKAA